jgi:Holliday junction DNA helicase RuvA
MIAKLTGILDSASANGVILDVAGVGYLVSCSSATQSRLPAVGEPVSLLIDTHVREDRIQLFGFADQAEREWFRRLTTVQGVGAKLALALLSTLRPDDLLRAIAAADKEMLTRADGVGQKLATRIVSELKDRIGTVELAAAQPPAARPPGAGDDATAAVSALVNLGYRRTEAFGAVAQAAQRLGGNAPIADLIRAGLQELGR